MNVLITGSASIRLRVQYLDDVVSAFCPQIKEPPVREYEGQFVQDHKVLTLRRSDNFFDRIVKSWTDVHAHVRYQPVGLKFGLSHERRKALRHYLVCDNADVVIAIFHPGDDDTKKLVELAQQEGVRTYPFGANKFYL